VAFLVLANPENRRCQFFEAACARLEVECRVLSWESYLQDPALLDAALSEASALRIESPGENEAVYRLLLAEGAERAARESTAYHQIARSDALELKEDHGRLRYLRQWWHGWSGAMERIAGQSQAAPHCRVMNAPDAIGLLFDKDSAQAAMEGKGIPVPERYGIPQSLEHLLELMEGKTRRAFVKPCHSSSASGVVALQLGPRGLMRATTPVEIVREDGDIRLYNSLQVRTYTEPEDVRDLIDTLCRERVLVEQWFPKAGVDGRTFDLRLLVVGGTVSHVVVRTSQGPITNLHLGNQRGELESVIAKLGPQKWEEAGEIARAAAACFPSCHYVAVDLMVDTSCNQFAVAETNAFGDLLPRVEYEGMDTYTYELATFLKQQSEV